MINGRYLAYLTGDSMEAASGNHTSLGEAFASSIKTPERTRHTAWIALSISVAAAFFSAAPAQAELKGEFIPFPEVTFHFDDKDIPALEQHGSEAAVDFFYTAELGQARLLAEFFVDHEERDIERLAVGWVTADDTRVWFGCFFLVFGLWFCKHHHSMFLFFLDHEERDIERLAGGWVTADDTRVWFGRFHTALGQWNRKHHHGTYLQTTIFRPGIIEWEDDGGVIPAHSTGISFETMNEHGTHMLRYSLDVGLGPQLTPGNLKALDVLKPGDGEHNLMVVGAISHHGEARPMDDNGLFAGYIRIPSSVAGIREVEQIIFGGYAIYSPNKWHFSASALWINGDVDLASGENDASFGYGYFQPEYWLNNRWILYGRLEGTMQGENNLYLQQIPAYVRQRALIGARYQFTRAQALKIELAALEQYDTHFAQAAIQWSAALP